MSLESYQQPGELYLARGEEVNPLRPLFTGDVLADVPIPGVQDGGMAMVIAHPCTMRGKHAQLRPRVIVAAVQEHDPVQPGAWTRGHFDKTPLPELVPGGYHVGQFDELGKALTDHLEGSQRLACMSAYGINLLQQRLVWNLTRLKVETFRFQEAFAHTLEEADLLEEWNEAVCGDDRAGRSSKVRGLHPRRPGGRQQISGRSPRPATTVGGA